MLKFERNDLMFDSALGNLNARFTLTIQLYVVLCLLNVLVNRFEHLLQFLSRLKALNFSAFNRANKRPLSAALLMQTSQHNTINNVDYI